jgi:large subunit ribosomal protein L14
MISVGTYLRVIDNSGAKFAKCIRVLGKVGRSYGYVGDVLIVTIKDAYPGKKIKKGEVCRAVLVRVTKERIRYSGDSVKFDDNSIVIITKKNMPVASRILGSVMSELRVSGFTKIVGLAQSTV